MSPYSNSNTKTNGDPSQRIMDQYKKVPEPDQRGPNSSSSNLRSKRGSIRQKLLGEVGKCEDCGITTIDILTVHHKDGNPWNNRRINLELLCPNCHAVKSVKIAKEKKRGFSAPVAGAVGRKNVKSEIVLRDIREHYTDLFENILSLSRDHYIYFGYYGYGSTKKYLKSQSYHGTQALLEDQETKRNKPEYLVLENLVYEGGIFASWDSLIKHLDESGYKTTPHSLPSSSKVS